MFSTKKKEFCVIDTLVMRNMRNAIKDFIASKRQDQRVSHVFKMGKGEQEKKEDLISGQK